MPSVICTECVYLLASSFEGEVIYIEAEENGDDAHAEAFSTYLDNPAKALPHPECERAFDPIRLQYRVNHQSWTAR